MHVLLIWLLPVVFWGAAANTALRSTITPLRCRAIVVGGHVLIAAVFTASALGHVWEFGSPLLGLGLIMTVGGYLMGGWLSAMSGSRRRGE